MEKQRSRDGRDRKRRGEGGSTAVGNPAMGPRREGTDEERMGAGVGENWERGRGGEGADGEKAGAIRRGTERPREKEICGETERQGEETRKVRDGW